MTSYAQRGASVTRPVRAGCACATLPVRRSAPGAVYDVRRNESEGYRVDSTSSACQRQQYTTSHPTLCYPRKTNVGRQARARLVLYPIGSRQVQENVYASLTVICKKLVTVLIPRYEIGVYLYQVNKAVRLGVDSATPNLTTNAPGAQKVAMYDSINYCDTTQSSAPKSQPATQPKPERKPQSGPAKSWITYYHPERSIYATSLKSVYADFLNEQAAKNV